MTSSYQAQSKGTINVFNLGFQISADFAEAICARSLSPCPGKEGLERGIPKDLVSGQFAPTLDVGFSLWLGLLQESEPREAGHTHSVYDLVP